jgi:gluconolactonase
MTRFTLAASICLLSTAIAAAQAAVVRLDPALDTVVAPDAKVELVKGGFGFTEGPVWKTEGNSGYLLFTDIPGNVVWKLTPDGKASVYSTTSAIRGRRFGAGAASRTTASTATIRASRNSR